MDETTEVCVDSDSTATDEGSRTMEMEVLGTDSTAGTVGTASSDTTAAGAVVAGTVGMAAQPRVLVGDAGPVDFELAAVEGQTVDDGNARCETP